MTREQHLELHNEYHEQAKAALHYIAENGFNQDKWNEYKTAQKASNKHFGIARSMYTRQINKMAGYKLI